MAESPSQGGALPQAPHKQQPEVPPSCEATDKLRRRNALEKAAVKAARQAFLEKIKAGKIAPLTLTDAHTIQWTEKKEDKNLSQGNPTGDRTN